MSLAILVVGSGGREHTIVWKLAQSSSVQRIIVAPGNGGITPIGFVDIRTVNVTKNVEIVELAQKEKVNWVIVGPEVPLAEGLADDLQKVGILCFGPSKQAARIEASKSFAKDFMVRHKIPTARYQTFTDVSSALSHIDQIDYDVVVKASGLAAGKGVIIPKNKQEAKDAIIEILDKKVFGEAGESVVVEEFLVGEEASFLAFSDGTNFVSMPPAQDHKRANDGDKGLNTGGMGAFAPSPSVDKKLIELVDNTILAPAIKGMKEEGYPFVGVLYAGVIITKDGPKTLEYNCRFGDPETQVLLPLLKSDLALVIQDCLHGKLSSKSVEFDTESVAATVVAASSGYPNSYPKGKEITISGNLNNAMVFHAGTAHVNQKLVTSGGRVLAVTGKGKDLKEALAKAYEGIGHVHFEGMQYRKDIGAKKLKKVRLGVLGSTRGTDLQAIIDAIEGQAINAEVSLVVSNVQDAFILERAAKHSVPHKLIPSKGKSREEFEKEVVAAFESVGDVDLVLLIGFMKILSPYFVAKYEKRMINVHPSLLPKFAGGMDMDVHSEVIKAKETKSGCTVHFVTNDVDKGEHLIQLECPVSENETSDSLKAKVQNLEGIALIECIRMFQQGRLKPKQKSATYSEAGVDIEKGASLVENIKPFAKSTARTGTTSSLGGKSLFDLKATGYKDPILVSGTDGVGTKLEIAKVAEKHDTIGIDLVAMCVNDVLVHGAEPLYFLDYFATGALNVAQGTEVIKGIARACEESGCALTGGETAEMPGLYKVGDYDLAGFCVGAVERDNLLPRLPTDIKVGDLIVGLTSSGFHSNGFSLVRHLIKKSTLSMTDPPPFPTKHKRLCDVLLEPTKLYVKSVLPLMKSKLIKASSHITGGGLPENIPRVFGKGGKSGKPAHGDKDTDHLAFELDMSTWNLSSMFKWFVKIGNLEEKEALRTFNCGIGFVLIIGPEHKDQVMNSLSASGEEAFIIGKVVQNQNKGDEDIVKIHNSNILREWVSQ